MRKLRIGLLVSLVCLALGCCLAFTACKKEEEKQTYTVAWQYEHATVKAEGYDTLPTELEDGTVLYFTVEPEAGWEVSSVTPVSIKKEGEKYKLTVDKNITVNVKVKEAVERIEVKAPETLIYYAGETIDAEDYVVTVYYKTNRNEVVDNYIVAYQNGDAFKLGDTKFSISYGDKTEELTLAETVKGKVTLKLDGGVLPDNNELADLPEYSYDETKSTASWTFDKALENDIALPSPTKEVNGAQFPFIRWSGVNENKIEKGLDTSLTVTALYDTQLVEISKLEFTTKVVDEVTVPYLVITGRFIGATEAYLFLFEGNKPVTSLNGPTVTKQADTDEFKLEFDLRDFVNAQTDELDETTGEPTGNKIPLNLKGKWMDIKFCAKVGERTETQEINLNNYAEDFVEITDSLESKVGDNWWQFTYKTHTPNPGDTIHGTDGGEYVGDEVLLKLVYQDCPPMTTTSVTIEERSRAVDDVATPTAYLVISGKVLQAKDKTEAETILNELVTSTDKNKLSIQADSSWEYPATTKAFTVDEQLNYTLTLSLDALANNKNYYVHFSGNNLNAKATPGTVTIGAMEYTLSNNKSTSWTNGLVWISVADTSIPQIKTNTGALQLELDSENEKVYAVVTGTYKYIEADALKTSLASYYFDYEKSDWSTKEIADEGELIVSVDAETKTWSVKWDITDLEAVENGGYLAHWGADSGSKGDIQNNAGIEEITCGGKTYSYKNHNFGDWNRNILMVKNVTPDVPEVPAE